MGKILKRLWPDTSSKNDGHNTGTTTEKQSRIESRTSMECEAAEEEREQCQSRERGIGDVVHAPGTESSDEIHHDRDSSNKDSSSPIQGAGPDPQEYMNIIRGLTELPSHMEAAALRNPDCKIQTLWLQWVSLTYSGANDLVSALSTNHTVTELDLSGNKLGDSGVKLVSDALRNPDCKIHTLGLDNVGLTDSGAKDLASALITNHTVTELHLNGNKLGDSGVKLVSDALRNPDCKIQTLWLCGVDLTDSGAEDLVSALSTNTSLTELYLARNSLTDRCVPALRRLILTLPSLKLIWLWGNKFSADGQNQLKSLQGTRRGLGVFV
ncbi:NACHT, LRR and PYD domains-containing protein 12-like [Amblyraja radiata]|uniref:NACHT, LRR and PYD domains-containing protein 12-like n=1 Tax=Amblyraja radiata TaxID=386614 RepID=UPI001401D381|nr:NACHT, LRR and PYD domains-containing protein 12-like [Amblyraja radiata]